MGNLARAMRREPEAAAVSAPTLAAVYADHAAFVWRSLRGLGVPSSAVEDAVQEVFVVVHRRLAEFRGQSAMTTWLFGIALHVAQHHRRSAARRDRLVATAAADLPRAPAADPFDAAARGEAARTLDRLLDALDEDQRAVFVMAEIHEMTATEIAAALGANPNTVRSRLRTARAAFEAAAARHDPERRA